MDFYSKMLKKKLLKTRLLGILAGGVGIAYVLFYYFKVIAPWLCVIMLSYVIALNFMLNSTYQEIFSGIKLSKVNLALATLFLLGSIGLMVYAIMTGKITF